MSNVVTLPPLPIPPPHDLEPRQGLRWWGRRLTFLFGCLFGLGMAFEALVLTLGLVCGGAFLWLAPGAAYVGFVPANMPGLIPFGNLPAPTRWAYAATFALNTTPALVVLFDLRRMAGAYANGVAFNLDGVKRLRRIGLCLVAYALAPVIGHGLVLLAGHGVDLDYLHASSFHAIVLAAVAITLAEVTRIGLAVQTDRDEFV